MTASHDAFMPVLQSSYDTEAFEQTLEVLKAQGIRLTLQRAQILKLFFCLKDGDHLTAEQLFHALEAEGLEISLATTYRTLKLLASVGVLRELDFAEDHKHYELIHHDEDPHHHLICVMCGLTVEFESDETDQASYHMANTMGFKVHDIQLKVFGVCPTCQAKKAHKPLLEAQGEKASYTQKLAQEVLKRRSSRVAHPQMPQCPAVFPTSKKP
ncbi:MAG: Fur family transcriptional regulator [Vampirovibrionales bacterium]